MHDNVQIQAQKKPPTKQQSKQTNKNKQTN
jgi:hypothetical protein